MEKDKVQKYAESLEKSLAGNHHHLKRTVEDFQEKCLLISPEKKAPPDVVLTIRETYKEIQQRITEIKAIQQLLKGKYRQYVRPNPVRDKDVLELGFLAKTCHSKVEYTLMQIQAKEKAKDREKAKGKEASLNVEQELPSQWFRSKENQIIFSETLHSVREHGQEVPPRPGTEDRREVPQSSAELGESFTLFIFQGDPLSLNELQSQIHLRELDLIERVEKDELRGVLIHLREVDPSEMEGILQRFIKSSSFSKLRCLLIRVRAQEDLGKRVMALRDGNLREMAEGETRSLTI